VVENESATIRLLEIDSGKVRAEFRGHRDGVHDLAFSHDGRTLASGGEDNVIYLWNVVGDVGGRQAKPATETDLARWWTDLASADARKAGAAITGFIPVADQSVKALGTRLQAIEPLEERRLAQLLADLDTDVFARRQSASDALAEYGDRIEEMLRGELKQNVPIEVRRRIQVLLDKIEVGAMPLATLQRLRAIEVLERIGTPSACRTLERLAAGAPEAWETRAARSALGRCKQ
jgi:hypothetical protein